MIFTLQQTIGARRWPRIGDEWTGAGWRKLVRRAGDDMVIYRHVGRRADHGDSITAYSGETYACSLVGWAQVTKSAVLTNRGRGA